MTASDIAGSIGEELNGGGVDYIFLTEAVGALQTSLNFIMGFIVYLLVIGVPLIVSIELLYINTPPLRELLDNILDKYKGNGARGKAIELILRDAVTAVYQAETIETGKSANAIYLGIKCKSLFLAALIVGITLRGGPYVIAIIINIATNIIQGISGAI